jgi:transcription antitermination factor NusG
MNAIAQKKPIDRRWYCIAAEPNMDVRFARDLGERGYWTFVAWRFTRHKVGANAFVRPVLKFSPYVWVRVDYGADQDFSTVKQTLGFSSAVSLRLADGDTHPSEIPEAVIPGLTLDMLQDFDEATRRVRRKESLDHPGQLVRVIAPDIFAGLEGRVSETRPGGVVVALGPMGMPARLRDDDVVLVSPFSGARAA